MNAIADLQMFMAFKEIQSKALFNSLISSFDHLRAELRAIHACDNCDDRK